MVSDRRPKEIGALPGGTLCFICRQCAMAVAVAVKEFEVIDVYSEDLAPAGRMPCSICPNCHSLVDVTDLTEGLDEREGLVSQWQHRSPERSPS